jgi:exopolysaccharide/PEP-CTERM locus tyrosine autokinase
MSLIEDAVTRLAQHRHPQTGIPAAPAETTSLGYPRKSAWGADLDRPSAGTGQAADLGATIRPSVFGDVAVLPAAKLKEEGYLTAASRASATGHEFRIIKAPILEKAFAPRGRQLRHARRVVVTSAVAGEGKTFCAINLAISIAAAGNRSVLLIDADVAKPSVAGQLGLAPVAGLIDLLTRREREPHDLIVQTDLPGLAVLPAGRPEAHAGEYLATGEMSSLLDRLSADLPQFLIVIDTPPLLAVTETRALVQQAGQTLLVVSAGMTTRAQLDAALATIAEASETSLVLNKLSPGRSEFSSYYEY